MFKDLPFDSLLDVFKYFSLTERIRYERINSLWAAALKSIWRQQSVLYCSPNQWTPSFVQAPCHDKRHEVREGHIFAEPKRPSYVRDVECTWSFTCLGRDTNDTQSLRILGKCKNLRALYWDLPVRDRTGKFGHELAQLCPLLEHLFLSHLFDDQGQDLDHDQDLDFKQYLQNVGRVNIKCLKWIPRQKLSHLHESVIRSISLTVEALAVPVKLMSTFSKVISDMPKLKHLLLMEDRHDMGIEFDLKLIIKFGETLESLDYRAKACLRESPSVGYKSRGFSDRDLRDFSQNLSLKSIFIDIKRETQLIYGRNFRRLEEVCFSRSDPKAGYDLEASFELFIRRCGSTLRKVSFIDCIPSLCQLVADHCPLLETFKIKHCHEAPLGLDCLKESRNLKVLDLKGAALRSDIRVVLEVCPKLRRIEVGVVTDIVDQILAFKRYAECHPKRKVKFAVSSYSNERKGPISGVEPLATEKEINMIIGFSEMKEYYGTVSGISGNFRFSAFGFSDNLLKFLRGKKQFSLLKVTRWLNETSLNH